LPSAAVGSVRIAARPLEVAGQVARGGHPHTQHATFDLLGADAGGLLSRSVVVECS